jgi:hypothetical protein
MAKEKKQKRSGEIILDRVQELALTKWLDVPRIKITPCALILPRDLDFDTWAKLGPKIAQLKRFTAWILGDWLDQGEIIYGETFSQAVETTG